MTAYHFQPWEVPAIEAGRTWSALRPEWEAPYARHAKAGELLTLRTGKRLIAEARCIMRAPVLVDAFRIRSAFPVEIFDNDPHARALDLHWQADANWNAARVLGYPAWSYLAWRLEQEHGRPPWALELIVWRPLRVAISREAA